MSTVLAAGDAAFAGHNVHSADPTPDLNVLTGQASHSHSNSPVKPALHWHKAMGHFLHSNIPGVFVYELASHDVHTEASDVFENLLMLQAKHAEPMGCIVVPESGHHFPTSGPNKHCWNHSIALVLRFAMPEYACGKTPEVGCCPSTYPQFAFSVLGVL